MPTCDEATKFIAILAEYNRLRESSSGNCYCDGAVDPIPAIPCLAVEAIGTDCMTTGLIFIFSQVTNKMFDPNTGTMRNGNCYQFSYDASKWGLVTDPSKLGCYETSWQATHPGLSDYLQKFLDAMTSITCAPQEYSLNMGAQFPLKAAPCAPGMGCKCDDPCTNSCNYGEVCYGPYCFDIIVYTDGDVDVDDDLVINDSIIENGDHTDPADPCPTCNRPHALNYDGIDSSYMALVEKGTQLCIDVVDQQGTQVGAAGTLKWKRYVAP